MRLSLLFLPLFLGCPVEQKEGNGGGGGGGQDTVTEPPADSDGDGLTDEEEVSLGTDPHEADSDGDGFDDPTEIEDGTSPTWEYSHVYEEGDYLIGACPEHIDAANAGPTGTGSYSGTSWDSYQEGDILDNFRVVDRWEQEIQPYAFCGNYMVITLSAEWCGPCQQLASLMADDMETIREDVPNFTFYEVLYQDNYGATPDGDVLRSWSREFGLDGIPVVAPRNGTAAWVNELNGTGSIPSTLLVAPNGEIIWSVLDNPSDYYLYDAETILDVIQEYEASQP